MTDRRLVSLPIKLSSPATREFWEIPVLYEDDELLAVDKPARIPVAPDTEQPDRPSLDELIHQGIADSKPWVASRSISYLKNVHGLDSETTGVLLYAKNKAAHEALSASYQSDRTLVEYVTLVRDTPEDDQFEVSAKIADDPQRPGFIKVDPQNGGRASTQFEIVEKFRGWSLLRCRPMPPRLCHQIRIHLSEIRHPVAGDFKYGGKPLWLSSIKPNYRLKPGKKERPLISAPTLHVEKVMVSHPTAEDPVMVESPWPKELVVAVKFLRQYAVS